MTYDYLIFGLKIMLFQKLHGASLVQNNFSSLRTGEEGDERREDRSEEATACSSCREKETGRGQVLILEL